jgi:hypothetical protein
MSEHKKLKDELLSGLTDELKDSKKTRNRIMNMFTIAFIIALPA